MIIKGKSHQSFVFVYSLCTQLISFHAFFVVSIFFLKIFQKYHQSVNNLDPDQARHFITSTCNVTNSPR